jgi:predicted nucleic acid-binding protein
LKQDASFDASFWINACRAGLLAHVLNRYGLRFAPAVAAELLETNPSGREFWSHARRGTVAQAVAVQAHVTEFGPGERAAIDLALEHSDWVLLLDDCRPFQAATALGLRVVCTPVFAVGLYADGTLSAEATLHVLARLAAMQTVSPHLLAAALGHLGRLIRGGWKGKN